MVGKRARFHRNTKEISKNYKAVLVKELEINKNQVLRVLRSHYLLCRRKWDWRRRYHTHRDECCSAAGEFWCNWNNQSGWGTNGEASVRSACEDSPQSLCLTCWSSWSQHTNTSEAVWNKLLETWKCSHFSNSEVKNLPASHSSCLVGSP